MLKTLIKGKGNYRRIKINEYEEHITYLGNIIGYINHRDYLFKLDNCGWHTRSTTRAINDIRRHFTAYGYTELK